MDTEILTGFREKEKKNIKLPVRGDGDWQIDRLTELVHQSREEGKRKDRIVWLWQYTWLLLNASWEFRKLEIVSVK
jgi:hypothetical protein